SGVYDVEGKVFEETGNWRASLGLYLGLSASSLAGSAGPSVFGAVTLNGFPPETFE
ncbi:unnamed protein product, partial [Tilletia controversa]